MSVQQYQPGDNQWTIIRKILQDLAGIASGSTPIPITPGSAGAPSTSNDVTVSSAGTAVLAIAANSKGIISASVGNTGLLYVGDSTVTNGSGAKEGLILSQAGFSPVLSGPVYVNADTSGDKAGVTLL